mmetsp:Transcript_31627/g.77547  ORF Transcript_31627/g.77547 Transcript_31627/m.77547 type:complete len:336 (-) Transcript_31627:880-1887(-)
MNPSTLLRIVDMMVPGLLLAVSMLMALGSATCAGRLPLRLAAAAAVLRSRLPLRPGVGRAGAGTLRAAWPSGESLVLALASGGDERVDEGCVLASDARLSMLLGCTSREMVGVFGDIGASWAREGGDEGAGTGSPEKKGVSRTCEAVGRVEWERESIEVMRSFHSMYASCTRSAEAGTPLAPRRSGVMTRWSIESSLRGKWGQRLKWLPHARAERFSGEPTVRKIFISWSLLKLRCVIWGQLHTHSGFPLNGGTPIIISSSTHPTPHSSTFGVYVSSPISSSGARYQSVTSSLSTTMMSEPFLASPKSHSLAARLAKTSTLDDLMSWCTIPSEWM